MCPLWLLVKLSRLVLLDQSCLEEGEEEEVDRVRSLSLLRIRGIASSKSPLAATRAWWRTLSEVDSKMEKRVASLKSQSLTVDVGALLGLESTKLLLSDSE